MRTRIKTLYVLGAIFMVMASADCHIIGNIHDNPELI